MFDIEMSVKIFLAIFGTFTVNKNLFKYLKEKTRTKSHSQFGLSWKYEINQTETEQRKSKWQNGNPNQTKIGIQNMNALLGTHTKCTYRKFSRANDQKI